MNKIEEINYILKLNNRFDEYKPTLIKTYQQFLPDWDPEWIRDRIENSYVDFSSPIFETMKYIYDTKQDRINHAKSELEKIQIEGLFQENFQYLYEDYQAYTFRRTKALHHTMIQLMDFLKEKSLINNATYDTFQEKQQLNCWIEPLFFQTKIYKRTLFYEYQYLENNSYLESFLPNQLDINKKEMRQLLYHSYIKENHLKPDGSDIELATQLADYKRKLRHDFLETTIKPTIDFQNFCSNFMSPENLKKPLDFILYKLFLRLAPAVILGTTVETNDIVGIVSFPVFTEKNLKIDRDFQHQLYHEIDHILHAYQIDNDVTTGLEYVKENKIQNRMVNEIQTEINATRTVQFFRDHQTNFHIPAIEHSKLNRNGTNAYRDTYYLAKPFFDRYQKELKELAHTGNPIQIEEIFGEKTYQAFSTKLDVIGEKLEADQITADQLPNINETKRELNQLMNQLNDQYQPKVKTLHR